MESKIKLRNTGEGHLAIRNGIWKHIEEGCMTPYDFAVYVTIYKLRDYKTGIAKTTSQGISSKWGNHNLPKNTVQECMQRLRKYGYIKYAVNRGQRGSYTILINKCEPAVGLLRGWQLNTTKTTDLDNPMYDYVSPTSHSEVYSEAMVSAMDDHTVEEVVDMTVRRTVTLPIQYIISQYTNNPTQQETNTQPLGEGDELGEDEDDELA
jgi:hypothetical protein